MPPIPAPHHVHSILPPTTFGLILAMVALLLHVFIASLVYRSASEHGMNPLAWASFYFFTGPIGWIAFQLTRDSGAFAGSNAAPSADPGRERVVDQRELGEVGRRSFAHLPKPSSDFFDSQLQDLMYAHDWPGALNHSEEMLKIAADDGNSSLVEDYRKVLIWIDAKADPFR